MKPFEVPLMALYATRSVTFWGKPPVLIGTLNLVYRIMSNQLCTPAIINPARFKVDQQNQLCQS
jgi:hypothetical protein